MENRHPIILLSSIKKIAHIGEMILKFSDPKKNKGF